MNERQVSNKALELADKLDDISVNDFETLDQHYYTREAAAMLRSQEKYINQLHKLLNYNGIGAGKDLLTGEVIPFEVNE
ncbi:hypothetical protein UFOVP230_35 [uncultured Caudovirales phage]|uniref:Uncharacterized protein n=1 Tax=uncultured Caudovirales phage TaxID=2100421 RepID=A0A6J7XWQ9_9CAUD|nr:hypothetical protein UFOVP230_35 [uncultured Caudovirales phage]